jgi:hypothetical protein
MNIKDAADICRPQKLSNGNRGAPVSNPGREITADIMRDVRTEIDRVRGLGWVDGIQGLELGYINARAYLRGMVSREGAREDLMAARAACAKLLLILDADGE